MERAILILRAKDRPQEFTEAIARHGLRTVYLCPIEYGCGGLIDQIRGFCRAQGEIECQSLDFISRFNRNAFELKDSFISFIADLGLKEVKPGKSLSKYLKCPFRDFSLWWFSTISERSPFKTNFYSSFVLIHTVLDFIRSLKVSKVFSAMSLEIEAMQKSNLDIAIFTLPGSRSKYALRRLAGVVCEALKGVKFYCVLLKHIIDIKAFNLKNARDPGSDDFLKSRLFLVTAFPYVDTDALSRGMFVNTAYGALADSVEMAYGKDFSWIGMYVKVEPYGWRDALEVAARIKRINPRFHLLEEDLSLGMLSRLIFYHLSFCLRSALIRKAKKGLFWYPAGEGSKLNLWPVFRNDFISSVAGKTLLGGLYYYFLFSRAVGRIRKESTIMHFCEMQAWEKALQIASKENSKHACVGLQHTMVPLLLLNYFNHPKEMQGSGFITRKPLSDWLGCVGQTTRDFFVNRGWDEKRVFVLGGFRFHGLGRPAPVTPDNKYRAGNCVAVAFSISGYVNKELLLLLNDAFNHKDCGFRILLRPHPCCSLDKIINSLKLDLDPDIFSMTLEPLSRIIPDSMAMIVKDSSSILEALLNDKPAIVPQLYNIVDMCPLSGISDLPIYVKDAKELNSAVEKIANARETRPASGANRLFLDRYLHIFEDKRRYFENINGALEG